MGTLTFAELKTELQYALENRKDLTDTRLGYWVNWSYRHVCMPNVYRHREMQDTQNITVVVSDNDYNLDADLQAIYSVRNATKGYKLRPMTPRRADESPVPTGQPRSYYTWGRILYLYPTPATGDGGDILDVRHWTTPALLTAAATTALPDLWDEVILLGAVWRGWRTMNRPDLEQIAKENFSALLNETVEHMRVESEEQEIDTIDPEMTINYPQRA